MSYLKNRRALGDDTGGATCRTGAAVFTQGNWWIPVKDASGKAYQLMQTDAILALPMCSSGSSSGGAWDFLGKIVGGVTDVIKTKVTPAPVTNVTAIGGGMSTTTKVAIAGAAALGLVLVLRSRK